MKNIILIVFGVLLLAGVVSASLFYWEKIKSSDAQFLVSQPEIKDKTIYYSLGNFIFDQYFDENTQKGMGVEVAIDPLTKKMNFKEYNFSLLKNGQTILK